MVRRFFSLLCLFVSGILWGLTKMIPYKQILADNEILISGDGALVVFVMLVIILCFELAGFFILKKRPAKIIFLILLFMNVLELYQIFDLCEKYMVV